MSSLAHRAAQVWDGAVRGLAGAAVPGRGVAAHRESLAQAVLAALACERDPALAGAAVAHLSAAVHALPLPVTTIDQGAPGAAAAGLLAHRVTGDGRLLPTVSAGVSWLDRRVQGIAERYRAGRAAGPPLLAVADYDAIRGLAGMGRLLLLAGHGGHAAAEPALRAALEVLTDLLLPRAGRPGWWSAPQDIAPYLPRHQGGGALTGIAHGVAGPLAFLAVAMRSGMLVDGQQDAVRAAAGWLLGHRDPGGGWPLAVPADQQPADRQPADRPAPLARWCTGATGIGRALQLAGLALGDATLAAAGVDAVVAGALTVAGRSDIEDPYLCHGAAGVLESVLAVHSDSPDPRLAAAADTAAGALLAAWQPAAGGGAGGLLFGLSGAAMAVHDYLHGQTSAWPALLLLR